jgi:hypothetical protein
VKRRSLLGQKKEQENMAKKILYAGSFLREGFEALGWEVVPLVLDGSRTLQTIVESTCPDADLVFIEFFGKRILPREMYACSYPVCAYCIDSLLNEFWFADLARLFDWVFVDQVSSVATLRTRGIDALWLPLCVPSSAFRSATRKEHFLTFVGRTTVYRKKRSNLLALLQKHFDITIEQNISPDAMQTLFSRSHVVLNENLFSGLTLRVFQVLASGSLLLTEAGGQGVERYFTHEKHLLTYSPDTLLPLVERLHKDIAAWDHVARDGQQACLNNHQSIHRVQCVLDHIAKKHTGRTRSVGRQERQFSEARSKYFHARRFGGSYKEAVNLLEGLKHLHSPTGCHAAFMLGSIQAQKGEQQKAKPLLAHGVFANDCLGLIAVMKLMVMHVHDPDKLQWLDAVLKKTMEVGIDIRPFARQIMQTRRSSNFEHDVYLLFAAILHEAGQIMNLGFLKQDQDVLPETSFDYAVRAYEKFKSVTALDALIGCADAGQVEMEIMPFVEDALLHAVAEDRHVLYAAEVYAKVYDFRAARSVLHALKKRKQNKRS